MSTQICHENGLVQENRTAVTVGATGVAAGATTDRPNCSLGSSVYAADSTAGANAERVRACVRHHVSCAAVTRPSRLACRARLRRSAACR